MKRIVLVINDEENTMPTYQLTAPRSYSAWRPRHEPHPLAAAFLLMKGWIERARQRRALAELDDQMLRDIGVTRVEAVRECDKPFWR